jgi:hypothetical protein
MRQFVILRHDSPQGVHFDFMVETAGTLKTWALPQSPDSGAEMPCEALPDHRLAYLDYEGPISGSRGSVTRWDRGICTVRRQSDAQWDLELAGDRLIGDATLRRAADDPNRWAFSFVKKRHEG